MTTTTKATRVRRSIGAWALWSVVVFGLFNWGASHSDYQRVRELVARGEFRRTPGNLVLLFRSYLTNDSDVARYRAYCLAALGRPYDTQFVRTRHEWEAIFAAPGEHARDGVRTPPAPLRPNRDFLVEYPPGFFIVALPPALLARSLDAYNVLFCTLMAALLTIALVLACRLAPSLSPSPSTVSVVAGAAIAALAAGPIFTHRYDPVVSLSLMAAAWAAFRGRPVLLGIALGLGVAAKLVPVLSLPIFALALVRERQWSQLALAGTAGAATIAAVFVPAFVSASGWTDVLAYHGARPLQIESSAAALLGLARSVGLVSTDVVFTYGSLNLVGGGVDRALNISGALTLAGLAIVYFRTWRSLQRSPSPERARFAVLSGITAALVISMVLGKVFSPQYLVWLMPLGMLLAMARGGPSPWLFGIVLLIGNAVNARYGALVQQHAWACALILFRNALLVVWALDLDRRPAPLLANRELSDGLAHG